VRNILLAQVPEKIQKRGNAVPTQKSQKSTPGATQFSNARNRKLEHRKNKKIPRVDKDNDFWKKRFELLKAFLKKR